MAYIGQKVKATLMNDRVVDTMTGDGSDTTLELSSTPISINNTLVFINGIYQRQTTDYTLSGTTITFTEAPFSGAIVCAITGGGEHIGCPMTPMGADKLIDGIATDSKIVGMSASKLSGTLPALDGSALTGINNSISTIAVDPTITTNPADGVGTLIINSASGEMFVCTDATTDNNVWTNVGGGTGDIAPWVYQGESDGYMAGGTRDSGTVISKFSFASNTTATLHGSLITAKNDGANPGLSSPTDGFATDSGDTGIEKFAFAGSGVTASTHGDLATRMDSQPGGANNQTHGFVFGGYGTATMNTAINKFAFSSNTTADGHGDLQVAKYAMAGQSSETHGYASGGERDGGDGTQGTIYKFSMSNNVTSVSIGDLSSIKRSPAGHSSATHGYTSGGWAGSPNAWIQKFSFSSDGNASYIADLTVARSYHGGHSSTTHGFASNGDGSESGFSNVIDKFSFSSDGNATDHGDGYHAVGTGNIYESSHQV